MEKKISLKELLINRKTETKNKRIVFGNLGENISIETMKKIIDEIESEVLSLDWQKIEFNNLFFVSNPDTEGMIIFEVVENEYELIVNYNGYAS